MKKQTVKPKRWPKDELIDILEKLTGQKTPIHQMEKDLDDSISLDSPLGYSQFNELLLALGYDRVTKPFFEFLFGNKGELKNSKEMRNRVNEFRIKAMLQYGNVKFAFKKFREMKKEQIDEEVRIICPRKLSDYSNRHKPLIELKNIPQNKTPYLGYILLSEIENKRNLFKQMGESTNEIDELTEEIEKLKEIGRHNLRTYLTYDHLDVEDILFLVEMKKSGSPVA